MPQNSSEDTILGRIAKERDENSTPEDYINFEEAVTKLGLNIKENRPN